MLEPIIWCHPSWFNYGWNYYRAWGHQSPNGLWRKLKNIKVTIKCSWYYLSNKGLKTWRLISQDYNIFAFYSRLYNGSLFTRTFLVRKSLLPKKSFPEGKFKINMLHGFWWFILILDWWWTRRCLCGRWTSFWRRSLWEPIWRLWRSGSSYQILT